jgi:hypothetical protein
MWIYLRRSKAHSKHCTKRPTELEDVPIFLRSYRCFIGIGIMYVTVRLQNEKITRPTWFRSARVLGVSLSNNLRILGQIVQWLCRVRFRHVPYFRRFITSTAPHTLSSRHAAMAKIAVCVCGWHLGGLYLVPESKEAPGAVRHSRVSAPRVQTEFVCTPCMVRAISTHPDSQWLLPHAPRP